MLQLEACSIFHLVDDHYDTYRTLDSPRSRQEEERRTGSGCEDKDQAQAAVARHDILLGSTACSKHAASNHDDRKKLED